jgi:hypothetical protein
MIFLLQYAYNRHHVTVVARTTTQRLGNLVVSTLTKMVTHNTASANSSKSAIRRSKQRITPISSNSMTSGNQTSVCPIVCSRNKENTRGHTQSGLMTLPSSVLGCLNTSRRKYIQAPSITLLSKTKWPQVVKVNERMKDLIMRRQASPALALAHLTNCQQFFELHPTLQWHIIGEIEEDFKRTHHDDILPNHHATKIALGERVWAETNKILKKGKEIRNTPAALPTSGEVNMAVAFLNRRKLPKSLVHIFDTLEVGELDI